jgi:hypothetical protein
MVEVNYTDDDRDDFDAPKPFTFRGITFHVDTFGGIRYVPKPDDRGFGESVTIWYTNILDLLYPDYQWYTTTANDYQGEWFAVGLDPNGKWWYHQGSYGSCSGCDWLQGISTVDEAIAFMESMSRVICIGDDVDNVIEYLRRELRNLPWGCDLRALIAQLCDEYGTENVEDENEDDDEF